MIEDSTSDAEKTSSKIIADFPANFDCQRLKFLRTHLFELGNDTAMEGFLEVGPHNT